MAREIKRAASDRLREREASFKHAKEEIQEPGNICNRLYSREETATREPVTTRLLVERLGVGGGGSDVSVTGGLVRAGGELESSGSLEVGVAGGGVRGGVVPLEVEFSELGEHLSCMSV